MPFHEIPRGEWPEFFASFSRRHGAWLVTVHVFAPALGPHVVARDTPLEGIAVERGGDLSVLVRGREGGHLAHVIPAARRVVLERGGDGADEGVRIESANGTRTQVRFRSPQPTEVVDGVILE